MIPIIRVISGIVFIRVTIPGGYSQIVIRVSISVNPNSISIFLYRDTTISTSITGNGICRRTCQCYNRQTNKQSAYK